MNKTEEQRFSKVAHPSRANFQQQDLLRYWAAFTCIAVTLALAWISAGPRGYGKAFGVYELKTFLKLVGITYLAAWVVYFLLSRSPNVKKLAGFVMMSVSFVLVIGLFELPALFGLIDYRKVVAPPESILYTRIKPWENPKNTLDPELIHIHAPNQHITGTTVGDLVYYLGIAKKTRYPVEIQYDQNGFRNDHSIQQADVVVLGDSFVESGLVPQSKLLTTRLGDLLGAEVANFGQSGYGPQQELVVLKRYGLPLKPKTVFWLFFEGNDLLDIPRYENLTKNWAEYLRGINSFKQRSFTRNVSLAFLGLTERGLSADTDEARRRSCEVNGTGDSTRQTLYFAYPGQPLTKEDLNNLGKAEDILLQARDVAAKSGAEMVLVFVPTKFRTYNELCQYPLDGYGLQWSPNDLPERLSSWSSEQGLAYLDLTPALKEAARKGTLVFFKDDGHWNAAGSETAAQALFQYLQTSLASLPTNPYPGK